MDEMKNNYKKDGDIAHELRHVDLENFLDFDCNGRYEFARCETCDGPLLGHLEVKCGGSNRVK